MTLNRMVVPALSLFLGATGYFAATESGLSQEAPRLTAFAQDRGAWDAPPQELQDIQRQGFRDGIEGARKDFENHRRPDVNNREEYRDPRLPPEQREAYRDGFRRGYERGATHLIGGPQEPVGQTEHQMLQSDPPMREPDRGGWDAPPQELRETQRQGFHDGIEGARKDFDNHRRPDVNNRDEFRHPNVSRDQRDAYREGFRRGYEVGVSHLMGDHDHDRDHDRDHDHN